MEKIINFLNDYLINFWFIVLLLMVGALLVIYLSPLPEIITLSKSGALSVIAIGLWRFLLIFFLPLSIISIILFLLNYFWNKNINKNNIIAIIIILASLTATFLLIIKSDNLDRDIKNGSLTIPIVGGPIEAEINE